MDKNVFIFLDYLEAITTQWMWVMDRTTLNTVDVGSIPTQRSELISFSRFGKANYKVTFIY